MGDWRKYINYLLRRGSNVVKGAAIPRTCTMRPGYNVARGAAIQGGVMMVDHLGIIPEGAEVMEGVSYVYNDKGEVIGMLKYQENINTGEVKQMYQDLIHMDIHKRSKEGGVWSEWKKEN